MNIEEQKKQYQRQYESWLTKNGWEVKRHTNDTVFSEISFIHPSKIEVNIIQQRDQSDRITFISQIQVAPDAQKLIASWPKEQQIAFDNEIKQGLILIGAQFTINRDGDTLKSIWVQRTIYGEGITKQIFFDNGQIVIDGTILALTIFNGKVGQQAAQSSQISDTDKTIKAPYG